MAKTTLVCPNCGRTTFYKAGDGSRYIDVNGFYEDGSQASDDTPIACADCRHGTTVMDAKFLSYQAGGSKSPMDMSTIQVMTILVARLNRLADLVEKDLAYDLDREFNEMVRIFGWKTVHAGVMAMARAAFQHYTYAFYHADHIAKVSNQTFVEEPVLCGFLLGVLKRASRDRCGAYLAIARRWVKREYHQFHDSEKKE